MFLKKRSFVLNSTLLVAAGMLITACGSAPKEEEVSAVDTTQTEMEQTLEASYLLPSPLQIANIFKKSGLKYKDGVTSNLKDPAKYTTNLSKAINLGVYSADLSYCVLNKQNQEAMNYMKLCRTMADNLGMGSVFEQGNLMKRFEKNLGNEDSLTSIIGELQMVTDEYLDGNQQQHITSIVFAGAWIESMYVGSKSYEKGKDQSLNNKLAEQMNILGTIINALKEQEQKDASISGFIADLQSIKDIYDKLPSVVNNPTAVEDTEKELSLTEDEVSSLTKKIEEVRTKFING